MYVWLAPNHVLLKPSQTAKTNGHSNGLIEAEPALAH
jgi:hypothetical protein